MTLRDCTQNVFQNVFLNMLKDNVCTVNWLKHMITQLDGKRSRCGKIKKTRLLLLCGSTKLVEVFILLK